MLLPSAGADLLVHFGSDDFAARWQRLEEKLPGWRQQYPRLAGVDLRYQRQTVLEMAKAQDDPNSISAQPAAKGATRPVVHTRPVIQRGRVNQASKQTAQKTVKKKPAHSPTAHRGTNG